jgi:hypothetical protein
MEQTKEPTDAGSLTMAKIAIMQGCRSCSSADTCAGTRAEAGVRRGYLGPGFIG